MDIARFIAPERFAERVEDLLSFVGAGVDDKQAFLTPGERGWQARDRNLIEGVPIHPQIVEQLAGIGMILPTTA